MVRAVVTLAVAVVAISGFWLLSGQESDTAKMAAEKQAAAFTADLYGGAPTTSASSQTASVAGAQSGTMASTQPAIIANQKIMNATLHTNMGDITIEFLAMDAPKTVANFTKLATDGFYNGTKFHRVIAGFMIQGGDPLTKDDAMQARWGTGNPGYQFADEIHANNKNMPGTISMANSGSNTNGSQFFINVAHNSFLDSKHTVFGRVVSGLDVVQKIENAPTTAGDRPHSPIVIESVILK